MKLRKKEKRMMSRNYVLIGILVIVATGCLLGPILLKVFSQAGMANMRNISICMVIYTLFCLLLWVPLMVPSNQIAEIDEDSISIMPPYKSMKKLKIAWYALINDHVKPFYRVIPLKDIVKLTLTFEAHWGAYAFQRFSYVLKFDLGNETFKVYLNPMQNGPLMPSGYGFPMASTFSNEDIINIVSFAIANGVNMQDPYKLIDAMKDENIVMYDYMVSLHKKISF